MLGGGTGQIEGKEEFEELLVGEVVGPVVCVKDGVVEAFVGPPGTLPFRSLGHLAFTPRPYQYVPLLMSLRLDPVRLLITDDVGVGKTVEAALVARELLDRARATAAATPNRVLRLSGSFISINSASRI